ncbi:uncharacterized protein LOC141909976 [Tubulanus polymorphus]|uniref:uncharacterized protein LOC141909976 n=1 Tax=Tubulanus polymorphus TaxID=672921 RepID=UPI003DA59577
MTGLLGNRKVIGRLSVIALILHSIIWANAKDVAAQQSKGDAAHSLTERALNADIKGFLEQALGRDERHALFKRRLTADFKGKHFMTTSTFHSLGTRQRNWDNEMTARLRYYRRDPNVISLIVANNDARLQTDIARPANTVPGGHGNLYRASNSYRVYDASIRVRIQHGRKRATVTSLIDRGLVNLILGHKTSSMGITMHYDRIDGARGNTRIHLHP